MVLEAQPGGESDIGSIVKVTFGWLFYLVFCLVGMRCLGRRRFVALRHLSHAAGEIELSPSLRVGREVTIER